MLGSLSKLRSIKGSEVKLGPKPKSSNLPPIPAEEGRGVSIQQPHLRRTLQIATSPIHLFQGQPSI